MASFLCVQVIVMLITYHTLALERKVTVPYTVKEGHRVATLVYWGQNFLLDYNSTALDLKIPEVFSILPNGDLVTNRDISDLFGKTISIMIISELPSQSWREVIHVEVTDEEPFIAFTRSHFQGHVLENEPPHSVVNGLDDLFATTKSNQNIAYSLQDAADSSDRFTVRHISDKNVQILTKSILDREVKLKYNLLVKACVTPCQDTSKAAFTELEITIHDQNDNAPMFSKTHLKSTISSTLPRHSTIYSVHAYDPDEGEITYSFTKPSMYFGLDPVRGHVTITSSQPLLSPEYGLSIIATDQDGLQSEPALLHVIVDDALRFEPEKGHRSKRDVRPPKIVELPESYPHTELVDIINESHDRFRLKVPAPRMIEIGERTGIVRLKPGNRLDYETQPEIDFTVIVTNSEDPTYLAEQRVKIRLQDENDERPEFINTPRPFLATVATTAPPGTSVYQLMAHDADQSSDIQYKLESGGEDRFSVDAESGVVRTRGSASFTLGTEYEIGVSCLDVNANSLQKSPTHSLKILVGDRDPQFYQSLYEAEVPEDAPIGYKVVKLEAFSFQGYPIEFRLAAEGFASSAFAIDTDTGEVDLLRKLDYEHDPDQYHMWVKAIENGRPVRTSTVRLIVNLVDENDNSPTFPLSQYIVRGIAETTSVGTDIMQVTATDLDSVTNAQLTYSVTDTNFTVDSFNNIGYIKTARRLDYDYIPNHTYNFTIMSTDNGTPARNGSATVRVGVTNINDEVPVFTQRTQHVQVSEDAHHTVVHVVQAYDPDGDGVAYSFKGDRKRDGAFRIDPSSGIITLETHLPRDTVQHRLVVVATDNGRCCGGFSRKSSEGVVLVEVKDVNNNAPRFPRCNEYSPTVDERERVGTPVIQIQAEDPDRGANGNITYSVVKSNDQNFDRFTIELFTGILRTADVFDREAKTGVTDYGVTIKAQDQGSPSLAGFCTLRVRIGDKNDNPPVFDLPSYATSLEEGSIIGKKVLQVYATDKDASDNGKVQYSIVQDTSRGFFRIESNTGWIKVANAMSGTSEVLLKVEARDLGTPSRHDTVDVRITITQTVNAYPQWVRDYSAAPIRVSENVARDEIVMRLKAISTQPGSSFVNYVIQAGETPEQNGAPKSFHSRIDEATNEMLLLVYRPLDYEITPSYTLTIKAANRATNSLHNDTRITIMLQDENDEIPMFVGLNENGRYSGSVAENSPRGTQVIRVTATDRDALPAYSKVTYRLKEIYDYEKFSIHHETGVITTTAVFDREDKSEYYVMVIAEDGARSDRPGHRGDSPNSGEVEVQIRVTDMNDERPFFKQRMYTGSVPENADKGSVIMTVTAEDNDEDNRLTYSITSGNTGGAFEVVSDMGEIRVRGNLDYEKGPREYYLTYRVFDDKFDNETTVRILITDVNDNPPRFQHDVYNVTNIVEEEAGISPQRPKFLLKVRATDPDTDRDSHIRYALTGQFADDGTFKINVYTGDISLTRPLDRDEPWGRAVWNFNILAYDEPGTEESLTGYAEVRVMPKDINDNAPVFNRNFLIGHVPEHSAAGIPVLTVMAEDKDAGENGTVVYSLRQVPRYRDTPLFSIDSETGLISTEVSEALDREHKPMYNELIVVARDRGSPSQGVSATVTIMVDDINDQAPKFKQKIFRATMSENLAAGASVTSVSATDADEGQYAELTYSLKEEDREFFDMVSVEPTNTGVLKIFKSVDYDSLRNPFFNLTVYVRDPNPDHVDEAYIEVYVTDYNDNAPVFEPSMYPVSIFENESIGITLSRFRASDRDTGDNRLFEYSIDRKSDPHKLYAINQKGLVTVNAELDREGDAGPTHRVHILAIDKGNPPQTGTGTLIVSLMDVNDNYPIFAEDYRPVVYENEPPEQLVAEISATDRDTVRNGPPFTFWVPCGGGCPCPENPACEFFHFIFVPRGGRDGHGTGVIKSLKTFDREERREYYLPIIMKDGSSEPMSGTNTLTITIGDRNDNPHYPAHKDIHVYNYKGEFRDIYLGVVPTKDKDDWDVVDKTFRFVNQQTGKTFSLDNQSGALYSRGALEAGDYSFSVYVYDREWLKEVTSSVTVHVQEIGDQAVFSSGSLRITDMTAEEFVDRHPDASGPDNSLYSGFRKLLAAKLNIPIANVDVFTVMNHPTLARTVDIRYAAHNSPYYRPVRLDGIINKNIGEFEALGLKIAMVPIDECMSEICESAGCSNRLVTTGNPLVINTNGTSLVGVTAYVEADCTCAARVFNDDIGRCAPDSCMNGGTCRQREQDFVCDCPGGFDGPRCQQTTHSFTGRGWAWYKPLTQCLHSHTSLEFIAKNNHGLIFYNGPIRPVRPDLPEAEVSDYILLELHDGYPQLRINHGSGEAHLRLSGDDANGNRKLKPLNDGEWHRIDIFREGSYVRMIVDQCKTAEIDENENTQTSSEDRRSCETGANTPGMNQYLNVHTPLQLGGRSDTSFNYPKGIQTQGFHGCIKNFKHNGELYDLHIGRVGQHHASRDGCPEEQRHCADITGENKCGKNGECIGGLLRTTVHCVCKPGWRGPMCSMPTKRSDFRKKSFIEWDFKQDFYDSMVESRRHVTDLQLMFRTRQQAGLLLLTQNAHKSEYLKLEVRDQQLFFRYNLGRGEELITLSHVNVSDGQWHVARVARVGRWVTLTLDGGEGRYYNYTLGSEYGHLHIKVNRHSMVAGGDVRFSSSNTVALVNDDYQDGCMNDIRFNGAWLPMDRSQNPESMAAEVITSQNLEDGCASNECWYRNCDFPLICVDLWRYSECRCPAGKTRAPPPELCVNINECLTQPCGEHGHCVDTDTSYYCECAPGYVGDTCAMAASEAAHVDVSLGAIVIILICALVLLQPNKFAHAQGVVNVIILLIIIYTRRRKPDQYTLAVDGYDDVRENIIHYDEEGVGEEDQNAYDINRLKKPIEDPPPIRKPVPPTQTATVKKTLPKNAKPAEMAEFIAEKIKDIEGDPSLPPHDSVREYAYEGGGSDAGSLSSLASSCDTHDQDFNYLNNWGPRFSKLANMYGDHPH